jgi:hypothetical protein
VKRANLILSAIALVLMGTSCGPSPYSLHPDRMNAEIIENAKKDIPAVRDLVRLFPSAGLAVYSDHFKKGTTRLQSVHVIYDRYEMSLTVYFEVNRKLRVISYGPPSIMLAEIVSIEGSPERGLDEKYGRTFRITQDQWERVVEAGGQFSGLGLEIKTNEPVDGIEKVKAYFRNIYH